MILKSLSSFPGAYGVDFYRQLPRNLAPLDRHLCLLVGICYTLGFATLTVGRLNILSITLVPILIGLAIDYGVHLIFRYEEELHQGRSRRLAIDKALGFTGIGVITTALTIAGAFFFMVLTDFQEYKRWDGSQGVA
jgi:predicted RND superfamily exporter protein